MRTLNKDQSDAIEDLMAEVRDLKALLHQNNSAIATTFRLPAQVANVLGLLLSVPCVSPEIVRQRLGAGTDTKVIIHRLRKDLTPWNITVHSKRSIGYWLDAETKDRIRRLIAGHDAPTATAPPAAEPQMPSDSAEA